MNLEQLYADYIESKRNSWSPTTLKNERWSLAGVTEEMLSEPQKLFDSMKARNLKSYSIKTKFVRAGEFVEFLLERGKLKGRNQVKGFMKEHANLFKQAYSKKHVDMTFEEAAQKINAIEDAEIKSKALQLLYSGMRYSESNTLENGSVVGKGGYAREIPMAAELPTNFKKSYHTLWRALKPLGITPHVLRKLHATKLVELGAGEADLMKVMGWRNSQMAALYVQASRTKKLTDALKEHLKGEDDAGE